LNHPNQQSASQLRKHLADIFALILALLGFVSSALVTQGVFEGVPHIEDEIAYVWQAKVWEHARGSIRFWQA
jgi:hypothetical protein